MSELKLPTYGEMSFGGSSPTSACAKTTHLEAEAPTYKNL
jgi:hypothetical protein